MQHAYVLTNWKFFKIWLSKFSRFSRFQKLNEIGMLARAWEVATSLKLFLEDSSNYFCKKVPPSIHIQVKLFSSGLLVTMCPLDNQKDQNSKRIHMVRDFLLLYCIRFHKLYRKMKFPGNLFCCLSYIPQVMSQVSVAFLQLVLKMFQ